MKLKLKNRPETIAPAPQPATLSEFWQYVFAVDDLLAPLQEKLIDEGGRQLREAGLWRPATHCRLCARSCGVETERELGLCVTCWHAVTKLVDAGPAGELLRWYWVTARSK